MRRWVARSRIEAALLLALGLVSAASGALSAQPLELEYVGQWGGTALAIDVQDTIVYLGEGPRLVTVDVADAAHPIEIGRSAPLPNVIEDLMVADGHAYVAADLHGLRILSVEDATDPVEVGYLRTGDAALDVFVVEDIAYVADRYAGITIVSVADKTSPERVGQLDTTGRAEGIVVSGDYAYVADGEGGLRVILIADPASPIEVGSCDTFKDASGLCVDGDYAYVVDRDSGLHVISIADPTHPVDVGVLALRRADDVIVVGDAAHVTSWNFGLIEISVADKANPTLTVMFGLPDGTYSAAYADGILFLAAGASGLQVYSAPEGEDPFGIGGLDTAGYAEAVAIADRIVYVVEYPIGLVLISMVETGEFQQVGAFALAGLTSFAIVDDYAYLCGYEGLVVVDVSDPAAPSEVGRVILPDTPASICVVGEYAYIACWSAGLQVVSVADPAHPTLVGALSSIDHARAIVADGDWVYVAGGSGGFEVVSVADPANPVKAGAFAGSSLVRRLSIADTYLIVGEDSALRTVSVVDPTRPVELGLWLSGLRTSAVVVDDYLLVGVDWRGVGFVSNADPTALFEVSMFGTAGRAVDVAISGDLVCVADQMGGLVVFRLTGLP